MVYIISDIHGNYNDFKRLLLKIKFNENTDHMYILGDIIDRGPESIRLLKYIQEQVNNKTMTMLMGNHELFAIMNCKGQLDDETWSRFGGEQTLKELSGLSADEKDNLYGFLEKLPYFAEMQSPILGRMILTHTGLDADNLCFNSDGSINVKNSIEKAIKNNLYDYMIGRDLHDMPYGYKRLLDSFLVVGHIPTIDLNEDGSNYFYRKSRYMVIDSGAGCKKKGGNLACYCVDTDEEIHLS